MQPAVDWLLAQHLPETKADTKAAPVDVTAFDDDDVVLTPYEDDIAVAVQQSAKGLALWDGQWAAAGYPSQSEADQALCNLIAVHTGERGSPRQAVSCVRPLPGQVAHPGRLPGQNAGQRPGEPPPDDSRDHWRPTRHARPGAARGTTGGDGGRPNR